MSPRTPRSPAKSLPASRRSKTAKSKSQAARTAAPKATTKASRDEDLLLKLLTIPGASGQEAAVQRWVSERLRKAGLPAIHLQVDRAHRRSPHPEGVGNLIVKLPGTIRAPRRMLVAHLDTVPLCVGAQPIRRGHFLYPDDPHTGLGADNRAGTAVLLSTLLRLLKQPTPHPPLTFLWTVQEEIGLQGARLVQRNLLGRPAWAFNWDGGSASKVTIGATGGYRMEIECHGKASHAGGAPEKGISAIAIAACAIHELVANGWHGAISQQGKIGTSNVGVIQGGAATNVVTDHVLVRAEARSHDPEFRQQIVDQIEHAFERAASQICDHEGQPGRVTIQGRLDYESFRLPADHVIVQEAMRAVRSVGREPELAIANGGLDANWLTAHGIPTVTLGCGQLNPHTVAEALDLREFAAACEIAWHWATGGTPQVTKHE